MSLAAAGLGRRHGAGLRSFPASAAERGCGHARRLRRYISVMVEVRLRAVRVDLQSNTPVLLLQEAEGEGRTLPIFIGTAEATAIAYALQGVAMPRPMTHDLLKDLLEALAAEVERVVITELRASTYYAELHLRHGNDRSIVSSRPSDAVAVAVRTGSPLFVSDELIDAEGILLAIDTSDEEDDASPEELVGQFREFLDSIKPEDFGS